jgi:hypothetical protein
MRANLFCRSLFIISIATAVVWSQLAEDAGDSRLSAERESDSPKGHFRRSIRIGKVKAVCPLSTRT